MEEIENPTAQDLNTCFNKWLESDDRRESLWVASNNEERFDLNDHSFRNAFHEGNRRFEKQIRSIMKQNSENQK